MKRRYTAIRRTGVGSELSRTGQDPVWRNCRSEAWSDGRRPIVVIAANNAATRLRLEEQEVVYHGRRMEDHFRVPLSLHNGDLNLVVQVHVRGQRMIAQPSGRVWHPSDQERALGEPLRTHPSPAKTLIRLVEDTTWCGNHPCLLLGPASCNTSSPRISALTISHLFFLLLSTTYRPLARLDRHSVQRCYLPC